MVLSKLVGRFFALDTEEIQTKQIQPASLPAVIETLQNTTILPIHQFAHHWDRFEPNATGIYAGKPLEAIQICADA